MESVESLLEQFSNAQADRCWIAIRLAASNDLCAIALLIRLLLNSEEDDSLRITILKQLVLRNDHPLVHQRFGEAVLHVFLNDPDDLVRQHAASALRDYIDVDKVLNSLEGRVRDESEDIDVRYNCLGAIEENYRRPECRLALGRLVNVPELGEGAQRTLDSF